MPRSSILLFFFLASLSVFLKPACANTQKADSILFVISQESSPYIEFYEPIISDLEVHFPELTIQRITLDNHETHITRFTNRLNTQNIKLIVAVAPLLGLLGTVTGMIDVFDVMATSGSNNARGMAAGVSKATIPTMAGMVVSLSGVLFSVSLHKKAQKSVQQFENKLIE